MAKSRRIRGSLIHSVGLYKLEARCAYSNGVLTSINASFNATEPKATSSSKPLSQTPRWRASQSLAEALARRSW